MPKEAFYAGGLRFSCTRCSSCCRYDPGFVFLSKKDTDALTAELRMNFEAFVVAYCRWVPAEGGMERLSLRERSNYDCIFWKNGCLMYDARPLQCKTFPFWQSILVSPKSWKWAGDSCPGVGTGTLHDAAYIESCLKRRRAEPAMARKIQI
jgi:Fe-S-cluster containining protein